MDWLDEDDDDDGIVGISHGGGEHIDKARKRFEYIVLPRFVFLILCLLCRHILILYLSDMVLVVKRSFSIIGALD